MRRLKEIKKTETGKCVLIAGGISVSDFDFSKVSPDIKRIAVNRCFVETRIDYQIFSDPFFLEWIKENPILDFRVLIGPRELIHPRVNYYYNFEDEIIQGLHTGFHALQLAQYLGFEEIYLVGYDYYCKDKLHYYEGEFNTQITVKEKQAVTQSLLKWLKDFDRFKWTAKIYNCNPDSNLKKFPFMEVIK